MSQLDTVHLKGESGNTYPFEVYPVNQLFNAVGAVYAVLRYEQKEGSFGMWYRHIYIGQTDDLSMRFDGHHKQTCFDRMQYNRIAAHVDGSEESRLSKESDILHGGTWPCNG